MNTFYAPDAQAEERGLLARRGFLAAERHAWISTDGSQSDIVLIRFSADTGAQSMKNSLAHGWQDPQKGSPFTDSADQASGVVISKLDDLGNASVKLVTARGETLVFVHCFTAATPDQQGAQDLLHRQLDALNAAGTAPSL